MKELLYFGVEQVARIHNRIMQLNNAFEMNFSDKDLHFLVIGLLGLGMLAVIYPLFRYLAKRGGEMTISFIYVFTVILVITFAIEIGQKISGTGQMEFGDIAYGLMGFLLMFALLCLVRGVLRLIRCLVAGLKKRKK